MTIHSTINAAWRSLWVLRRQHEAPAWARALLAGVLGVMLALALIALVTAVGDVNRPNWQRAAVLPLLVICGAIALTVLAVRRLAERTLPAPFLDRMSALRDWRAGAALCASLVCGVLLGTVLGFILVPLLLGTNVVDLFESPPLALIKFAVFLLVLFVANAAWWRARVRRKAMQHELVEAQLRLLQGQIEPHFLFNTLANVQSLMAHDPRRAGAMLEAFSDYLRAGLVQLRQADSTLEAELAMSSAYLELLQIRMEERLSFHIVATDAARAVRLPALLLQPLVENAIHHGLEPKVEGGSIRVSAEVRNGCLEVRVTDDGMGLDAPRRSLRSGSGMALANLRARLATRYGSAASLALEPLPQGAQATLRIPCESMA